MALMLCPSHGESDVAFVSPAVVAAVIRDEAPASLGLARLSLDFELVPPSRHLVDAAFLRSFRERHQLPNDATSLSGEVAAFEAFAELEPVCAKCLAEWMKKHGVE